MDILSKYSSQITITKVRHGQDEDGNPHTQVDLIFLGQKISVVTETDRHNVMLNDDPIRIQFGLDDEDLDEWFRCFVAVYSRNK